MQNTNTTITPSQIKARLARAITGAIREIENQEDQELAVLRRYDGRAFVFYEEERLDAARRAAETALHRLGLKDKDFIYKLIKNLVVSTRELLPYTLERPYLSRAFKRLARRLRKSAKAA